MLSIAHIRLLPLLFYLGLAFSAEAANYLGTPVQMYNSSDQLTWDAEYDSYGNVRKFSGSSLKECPFRLPGMYADEETGLCYNRFRYYSADSGTYLSQDPIGLSRNNPNIYAYVRDSNSWGDPFGLDTIRLRHYTSNQGLAGMKEDMVIKAYDQNTVFAEKAKGKPLSAADAADKYGIKKGSARNYVEFDVDADRVSVIKNKITGATEYTIKGDVKLDKGTTRFVKRCS